MYLRRVGEPDNVEGVSGGQLRDGRRQEIRRTVEDNSVTHYAVHSYVTDGPGITKTDGEDADPIATRVERIPCLRDRLAADVVGSIAKLEAAEELDVEPTVGLQLYCQEYESRFELMEAFERGRCNCD